MPTSLARLEVLAVADAKVSLAEHLTDAPMTAREEALILRTVQLIHGILTAAHLRDVADADQRPEMAVWPDEDVA